MKFNTPTLIHCITKYKQLYYINNQLINCTDKNQKNHHQYTSYTTLTHYHKHIHTTPLNSTRSIHKLTPEQIESNIMSLHKLQQLLQSNSLAGYIVPTADAHQSEYVATCDARREYITGFTGSAGTALVLSTQNKDKSMLWTDGRYFIQADNQLDKNNWQLMKSGVDGVPKLEDWCISNLPSGTRIGVDPTTISVQQYERYRETFNDKLELVLTEHNLVDQVWDSRPPVPTNPVFIHPLKYSGESTSSKVDKLRAQLKLHSCSALIVTALDEICWLFNLRGSDISYNPVFFAYGIVTLDTVILYINPDKLTSDVKLHLGNDIKCKLYSDIFHDIQSMKLDKSNRLWLDITKSNVSIYKSIHDTTHLIKLDNPIALLKGIKNETELNGMRQAHIRDGAAECNFLSWLERNINTGKHTECSIADKLAEFRSQQNDFVGLSFDTIAGSGSNGAIIHYRAELDTCKNVTDKELILLDSGAQYRDGTTDITRTFHLGTPTEWEKKTFTLVLKGHIALARAVFPGNVAGPSIDAFARMYLWAEGLDYMHGTGHGVGAFLNVHEGPHGIGME